MAYWIRSYWRSSWKTVCAFLIFMLILHTVLGLSFPLRDVWAEIAYLDLLLVTAAAACWIFGFLHYRSRYRRIIQALRSGEPLRAVCEGNTRSEDVRILQACIRYETQLNESERITLQSQLTDQRDVLACWAHDVKTPLSVCELILEREEAAPVRQPLLQELFRIRAQISHVLHVERVQHLHQSLHMQPIDIPALIRDAIGRNALLFQAREQEVQVDAPEVEVMGDTQAAAYILDQLLSNAAKYAPQGSCVDVRAWQGTQHGFLQVKDRGTGIPGQDIRRIFDKGYSGEKRNMTASTGMGLYYAQQTAKAMGGQITAQSGNGVTVFTLQLPRFNKYLQPGRDL